jgi:UDP-N-acetylmuramoyl-L-alanyl-D-glutamate--2,6-diaminopimelate ligase
MSSAFTDFLAQLNQPILGLASNSRLVKPGYLFIACAGQTQHGLHFVNQAIAQGAVAIFWEETVEAIYLAKAIPSNIPHQSGTDFAPHLSHWAGTFYQHPSQHVPLVGITGTNGKTSICLWLTEALHLANHRAASLGTVGNGFWGEMAEATHTTLDAITLQSQLAQYRAAGAERFIMEVSSHAMAQHRIDGVHVTTAIFTNLTRDHLDYHGDMAQYGAAKARLFKLPSLKHAIINVDDSFGANLANELQNSHALQCGQLQVIRYGLHQGDVWAEHIKNTAEGLSCLIKTPWGEASLNTQLIGEFNLLNLLAALSALCLQGLPLKQAAQLLSNVHPARGRLEAIRIFEKPTVIIDYAHTPDALEKTLLTLQQIKQPNAKLVCVFGCGGDRDKGKRPIMGQIASSLADLTVITNDNPRTESDMSIINDIKTGLTAEAKVKILPDRQEAIEWAIAHSQANDLILVAGKGHETYQIIGQTRHFLCDKTIALKALQ